MSMLTEIFRVRGMLALAGALAGLSLWLLAEVLPDVTENDRLVLALSAFCVGTFTIFLAITGPLPSRKAAPAAAVIGLVLAVLAYTASLRFDAVQPFIETLHPIFALALCIALPIPFLVAGLSPGGGWLDYPKLFDAAWNTVVRTIASLLFLGAVWGVIALSVALLGLVGVEIIEDLLDIEPVPYLLSGLVLGLGIGVADELAEYVSPKLILRLLRLLVPVVLVVTLIFLVTLPFRGVSGLFGTLSVAATLIAMAFAVATLVSTAIDRDDASAVQGRWMRMATRMLSLMLPVLAAFAVYSVSERVGQYGWSPDRLAAMSASVLMAAYGLTYAGAVLARREWMGRIRQANGLVALGVLFLATAWLTPLLNPQRLAAQSQIARYATGQVTADELDLWSIGREWGRPGEAAIEVMAQMETPEQARLIERLAALEQAGGRYAFETSVPPAQMQATMAAVRAAISVLPDGAEVPEAVFAAQSNQTLENWQAACDRRTPEDRSGCIALRADLLPEAEGDETLMFFMFSERFVQAVAFGSDGGDVGRFGPTWMNDDPALTSSPGMIDRIASGQFSIGPTRRNALSLGESELILLP
ncbi:MAG: DUF4153 domain-containing protein [Alphaproteobacteria bacterium]|nr:DUF4153 domain-containing protein [Alphaproteobacteria bacterium]